MPSIAQGCATPYRSAASRRDPVVTRVVDIQRLRGMEPDLRQPSTKQSSESREVFTVEMTADSLRGGCGLRNTGAHQSPPFSFVADIPQVLSDILRLEHGEPGLGKADL